MSLPELPGRSVTASQVHHRPKNPGPTDVPRSMWVTLWCLGVFTIAIVGWRTYHGRLLQSEKNLQAALSSNKFKFTSAEDVRPEPVPPPPAPVDQVQRENAPEPPAPLVTLPERQAPVVLPTPLPPVEPPVPLEGPKPEAPKPEAPQPVEPPPVDLPPLPRVDLPAIAPMPLDTKAIEPAKMELPAPDLPRALKKEEPRLEAELIPAPVLEEQPEVIAPPTLEELVPLETPVPAAPPLPEIVAAATPEPPVLAVERTDETIRIYLPTHPGETPMLKNWQTLGLCSLMSVAMVAAPAPVEGGEKDKDKVIERLDTMEKALAKSFQDLAKDMESLKATIKSLREEDFLDQKLGIAAISGKATDLGKELTKLRTEIESLKKRLPVELPAGTDKAAMDEIRSKLMTIEQALAKLSATEKRVALASPQTGRVLLVNLYPEELLFVVNQKPYRVAPNATAALDNVPAGALNYEVVSGTWGRRAQSTTTLAPNETFTLTAR